MASARRSGRPSSVPPRPREHADAESSGLATAFLAFGASALIYLVFEEAMREARKQREYPWFAGAFLLSFAAIFLMGIALK